MYKQILTALLALSVTIGCGKRDIAAIHPIAPNDPSLALGLAQGAGSNRLPTCSGASDCAAGAQVCSGEDGSATVGPTVITDNSTGLSSDGRGPYVQGTDGVRYSVVLYLTTLHLEQKKSVKNPPVVAHAVRDPWP